MLDGVLGLIAEITFKLDLDKENEFENVDFNFELIEEYNGMDENRVKVHQIKNLNNTFMANKFKNVQNVKL